jgi:hypothetical protein
VPVAACANRAERLQKPHISIGWDDFRFSENELMQFPVLLPYLYLGMSPPRASLFLRGYRLEASLQEAVYHVSDGVVSQSKIIAARRSADSLIR